MFFNLEAFNCDDPEDPRYELFCVENSTEASSPPKHQAERGHPCPKLMCNCRVRDSRDSILPPDPITHITSTGNIKQTVGSISRPLPTIPQFCRRIRRIEKLFGCKCNSTNPISTR